MDKNIRTWIKHVGRGKTLARDLDATQAEEAIGALLDGHFSPAQAGAFLQALRIKETTVDELVGAAKALRRRANAVTFDAGERPVVVNLAFDTPRKAGVVSLLACAYLRRLDLCQPVIVWEPGCLFPETRSIEQTKDVLRLDPWLAQGECPMFSVSQLIAGWSGLSRLRAELGFRTILNTLEKVVRPLLDAPVLVGISHGTFAHRLPQVLLERGCVRAASVQGHHGTLDLGLGSEPTAMVVADAAGTREESVSSEGFPLPSILLKADFDRWPERIRDRQGPLWMALRRQAALIHSVASDTTFEQAVQILSSREKSHVQP
ncbi:MAG: hypothetical protein IPK50_09755 [Fibrobacterota bacterium]|nr:hypothetical protein [Fibrobacterota bacterium]QQS07163.1 MAG: hypothetical protein IPK50_09755 [Fibrobacterota bacterium]